MTDAPKPGSPEEAEARRSEGKGPFTTHATKDETGPHGSVVVLDAAGVTFCFIDSDYCVGGDLSAAKARATRIAEALNQRGGHAKPEPYIDDVGNLCAPAGFCFVASGQGVEMVPIVNVVVINNPGAPAP